MRDESVLIPLLVCKINPTAVWVIHKKFQHVHIWLTVPRNVIPTFFHRGSQILGTAINVSFPFSFISEFDARGRWGPVVSRDPFHKCGTCLSRDPGWNVSHLGAQPSPAVSRHLRSLNHVCKEREKSNERKWLSWCDKCANRQQQQVTTSTEQTADYSSEKLESLLNAVNIIAKIFHCAMTAATSWKLLQTDVHQKSPEILYILVVDDQLWLWLTILTGLSVKLVKLHRNVRLSN